MALSVFLARVNRRPPHLILIVLLNRVSFGKFNRANSLDQTSPVLQEFFE
jgi:hypothetical protein